MSEALLAHPDANSSGSGAEVIVEAKSLQVTYNRVVVAIDGISLALREGSIVAILGSNGAGKSTTLRALTGFLPGENAEVTAGEVYVYGRPQVGRLPHRIASEGMILVPERRKVFATLTVDENLAAVPTRTGGDREAMVELAFAAFPALTALRKRHAGLLSGGERQMLAIAKALVADPKILLIDELSLGIAPGLVISMMRTLQDIRAAKGISILLVEQNAAAALQIADHAHILQRGRIVLEGRGDELLGHPEVQRLYLGQGDGGGQRKFGQRRSRRAHLWDV
jgi:branched-chain amino acid transport system ATP-binding protein